MTEQLTAERLRELLDYDPETGVFRWKKSGRTAGSQKRNGYRFLVIDKRTHAEHRLAWIYMKGNPPRGEIDHMNRCRSDNRIANLRDVTRLDNQANKKPGASGLSGAYPVGKRFVSAVWDGTKRVRLGAFNTAKEAHAAYLGAYKILHGKRPARVGD